MNRKTLILLSVVALTIPLAAAVRGAGFPDGGEPALRRAQERAELTPLHREIKRAQDDALIRLAAIQERLESTAPGPEYLELQGQIEAIKKDAQVRVFDIQLRHAREEGRSEDAARLTETLRLLVDGPAPVPAPVPSGARPARPPRTGVNTPN